MSFQIIIPARLKSSRLPRKVLLDIGGKPMLQRVYEQAIKSKAANVIIATDSLEVMQIAKQFTEQVIMTKETHQSGTDRLAEVAEILHLPPETIIVNLQADEPFIPPSMLNQVASLLEQQPNASMATLCEPIHEIKDMFNPNIVKVVINDLNEAIYFSRASIPWQRSKFSYDSSQIPENLALSHSYRHIGLYAYRAAFLKQYITWSMSSVEQLEQLEQLRVLMHGHKIAIAQADGRSPIGVDTEEDLILAQQYV